MRFIVTAAAIFVLVLIANGAAMWCALGQMDALVPGASVVISVILAVLGFPFMDFWTPLGGDWLKRILGDGGTMILFSILDSAIWAMGIAWTVIRWRSGKRAS